MLQPSHPRPAAAFAVGAGRVDHRQPTTHGAEREIATRLDKLRAIIRKKR